MPNIPPDNGKLKELILFICQRSLADGKFGATKLNKLLFFADFAAYVQFGRSLTGQEYQKLEHGPAPRRVVPLLRELEESGDLAQARHNYFGRQQIRSVALRDADLASFSASEIALITELLEQFRDKNATDMSLLSHQFDGWQLARDGETIPYEVALVKLAEEVPTDSEISDDLRRELESLRDSA